MQLRSGAKQCEDLCIGYNSLSDTAAAEVRLDNEMSDDSGSSHAGLNDTGKPNAVRVWTWLVLCDDGTAIQTLANRQYD